MATRWLLLLRAVSALVLVTGLILLGTFAAGTWSGIKEQQHRNEVWSTQVGTPMHAGPRAVDPRLEQPIDGIDFAIRIPKLKYYAAVKEGTDSGVLYAGPGHYPATRWPGEPGTVGVAAHNVYWIDFPQLVKGDEIDLETRYGTYRYHVTGTAIVNPDDRSVLVPDADGFHLTLTTCWPLWAGAFATRRYIIFTDQYSPLPLRPGYG